MICHNRMLLCSLSGVACTTPDTSKSQPTVYCFAQLKQGTCLIRLKHCLDDFCPEEIRTGRKADTGPFGERGCPLCSFLIMYYLFVLALNCGDCYNAYDIVCRASSGQIVDRSCDTLGNRAVCFCLCQSLNQLVADVACIQGSGKSVRLHDLPLSLPGALDAHLHSERSPRQAAARHPASRSGFCSLAIFVASTTFVYQMHALRFPLWSGKGIATFGSAPTRDSKDSAEDAAIAASSSGFGS